MAHFERDVCRQELYRGSVFTVTTHQAQLEDGTQSRRDVVNHNGGATVAALTKEGQLLLVRQYRFAAARELSEFQAELAGLREQLRLLAEMEQFSIRNIL